MSPASVRFVLASSSPARLAALQAAGLHPEVVVSGVDEGDVHGPAEAVTALLAQRKARAVAAGIADPTTLVLGCDSVLDFGGRTLGKPVDPADGVRRWQEMRGHSGALVTGHCLIRGPDERVAVSRTEVRFGEPSDAEIEAYVATGEPLRVAGGFTIDGLGGWFVEGVDGDPGTVMGLSLPLLRDLLRDLGLGVPDLWASGRG